MLYYEAVQIFYRDCIGRMLSERTIENYSDYITGFGNYLQRVNKSNIEDVTRDDVLDYFAFKRKTCSETTIKHNSYQSVFQMPCSPSHNTYKPFG